MIYVELYQSKLMSQYQDNILLSMIPGIYQGQLVKNNILDCKNYNQYSLVHYMFCKYYCILNMYLHKDNIHLDKFDSLYHYYKLCTHLDSLESKFKSIKIISILMQVLCIFKQNPSKHPHNPFGSTLKLGSHVIQFALLSHD